MIVLDASMALAWTYADESHRDPLRVFETVLRETAGVPAVWPFEIANALVLGERRGRIGAADRAEALQTLMTLPIVVEEAPNAAGCLRIASLAAETDLTFYDAAYLDLARRLHCSLATLDAKLIRAAKALQVTLA